MGHVPVTSPVGYLGHISYSALALHRASMLPGIVLLLPHAGIAMVKQPL